MEAAISHALKSGYRAFDLAEMYVPVLFAFRLAFDSTADNPHSLPEELINDPD